MQLHCIGLPHSEIPGSMVICTYPKLIAAYHVLHRLPEPRHPPFALILLFSFIISFYSSSFIAEKRAKPLVAFYFAFFSFHRVKDLSRS